MLLATQLRVEAQTNKVAIMVVESPTRLSKASNPASSALAAAIVFIALSISLAAVGFCRLPATDCAYDTWTTWAVKEFLAAKERSEIVFLGSSLMLVPIDRLDADYTGKVIDGARHHNSVYFEQRWKAATGGAPVSTYNFALPGEMPSDAYLITKFLLKGNKRPAVVVYGVGPRDFLENLLQSPATTDPYQYLSRFGSCDERIDLIAPKWDERLTMELKRLNYFLGNSQDFSISIERLARSLAEAWLPRQEKIASASEVHNLLPKYRYFQLGEKDCNFYPTAKEARKFDSSDVAEYRTRYKTPMWDIFTSQMRFLSDTMDICNERDIHMVLVSMPITDINRQLIPKQSWTAYCQTLKALARSKKATFIDMEATKEFPIDDFQDTVHLHSGGGMKFFDKIIANLTTNTKVITALNQNRKTQTAAEIKSNTNPPL